MKKGKCEKFEGSVGCIISDCTIITLYEVDAGQFNVISNDNYILKHLSYVCAEQIRLHVKTKRNIREQYIYHLGNTFTTLTPTQ